MKQKLSALAAIATLAFFPAAEAQVPPNEALVEFEAELDVFIRENLQTGQSQREYFVSRGQSGQRGQNVPVRVEFSQAPPGRWVSGTKVKVRGRMSGNRINVDQVTEVGGGSDDRSNLGGDAEMAISPESRKTLVLMINASNKVHSATEIASMPGYYSSNAKSMRGLYEEISFGQLDIDLDVDNADGDTNPEPDGMPDVFGPVTINATAAQLCSNPFAYAGAALFEAGKIGVLASAYRYRIFALPRNLGCGWTGYASVGCGSACSAFNIWNHDPANTSHEFGHMLGFRHAGNDPDNNGLNNEYNDRSSFMGYAISAGTTTGSVVRGLDGAHHWQAGWYEQLDGNSVRSVTASGQHTLSPIGVDPRDSSHPTLIRIPVANGDPYYLSARIGEGYDEDLARFYPGYLTGVAIHRYTGSGFAQTRVIDTLTDGEVFGDASNELQLRQISRNNANGEVLLEICLGAQGCDGGDPTDDYPADASTTGTVVAGGTTGSIETEIDSDWLKVALVAGQTYQIDVGGTGSDPLLDPYARLIDPGGNVRARNNNSGPGNAARIVYTAATGGTYHVQINEAGKDAIGDYVITALSNSADDYPANASTTGVVEVGGTAGSIETSGDADWLKVVMIEGQTYQIDVGGTGGNPLVDPYARLIDPGGTVRAQNNNGGPGKAAQIVYTAGASGTYHLQVNEAGNDAAGDYLATVQELGQS